MSAALRFGISVFWLASVSQAAGLVHNENFVVFTEKGLSQQATDEFAQLVLAKAEEYRKQIAVEWFGEELPRGIGRTTINVTFAADRDTGLTWAVDHPDRRLHTIYLYTSAERAVGSTLAHEIAHAVLATQFPHPHRLPAWVEEGIASQYDHVERSQSRASVLKFFARQNNWPSIAPMLGAANIAADDTRSYAMAVSVTEMLLARGGKAKFLEFGRDAGREGTQRALERHYRIRDLAGLQTQWESWARHQTNSGPPVALSQHRSRAPSLVLAPR